MANTTQTAAQKKAFAKKIRQLNNENAAKFFAAGMLAMISLFIISHWTRYLYKRIQPKQTSGSSLRTGLVSMTRTIRRFLMRKVAGFTTAGHALLFLGYFATCISVAFTKIDWSTLNGFAKRLGWLTISNLAFITFLALKNTPLAFLTAYSYERLNVLHRAAGYCTVICSLVHAIVYIQAFNITDDLHELKLTVNLMGIVAGIAMCLIAATSILIRKVRYEAWYLAHITFYVLIVICVGMHRPKISTHSVIVAIFTGALWFSDRLIRIAKLSFFSIGNSAIITPLPNGGTHILLGKSPVRTKPGTHCFLWIPRIRGFETHPFTVASMENGSMSFVVAAYDGFTRDLHQYAIKNPGAQLRASIDGPYGTVPDFAKYNRIVLIAGGSGGSFTIGIAIDTIRRQATGSKLVMDFVWVVREHESVSWFGNELQELMSSNLVRLHIYSTGKKSVVPHASESSTSSNSNSSSSDDLSQNEKVQLPATSAETITKVASNNCDIEKQPDLMKVEAPPSLNIQAGRPEVRKIIQEAIGSCDKNEKIIIAACGPDSMMAITRQCVVDNIKTSGPSVELHCEQFGW